MSGLLSHLSFLFAIPQMLKQKQTKIVKKSQRKITAVVAPTFGTDAYEKNGDSLTHKCIQENSTD